MAHENTVLSLNPDRQKLLAYEAALREGGFQIISVSAPVEARFEIEMGRCGVFLANYLAPIAIYRDLASLFRRSCPGGLVVYLAQRSDENIPEADLLLSDEDEPRSMVKRIRAMQREKAS
jgi:hypothetical protein